MNWDEIQITVLNDDGTENYSYILPQEQRDIYEEAV